MKIKYKCVEIYNKVGQNQHTKSIKFITENELLNSGHICIQDMYHRIGCVQIQ